jgi:hypothetical protein
MDYRTAYGLCAASFESDKFEIISTMIHNNGIKNDCKTGYWRLSIVFAGPSLCTHQAKQWKKAADVSE